MDEILEKSNLRFTTKGVHLDYIFHTIKSHDKKFTIANDLVKPICDEIEYVLSTKAQFSSYRNAVDVSLFAIPNLDNVEENIYGEGWRNLVKYLIHLIDIIGVESNNKTKSLAIELSHRHHLLFKRLTWFIYSNYNIRLESELVENIKKHPDHWLWLRPIELNKGLIKLWDNTNKTQLDDLESVILDGPSKDIIHTKNLDDSEIKEKLLQDWLQVLKLINISERGFTDSLENLVHSIQKKNKNLSLETTEKISPPIQSVPAEWFDKDIDETFFSSKSKSEIIRKLTEINSDADKILDSWRSYLRSEPYEGIEIVQEISNEFVIGASLNEVLSWEDKKFSTLKLFQLLESTPPDIIYKKPHPITRLLRDRADYYSTSAQKYWKIWDMIYSIVNDIEYSYDLEAYTAALNHPIGHLVDAIIRAMRSKSLKVGDGIINGAKKRLELVINENLEPSCYILSFNYSYLYQVDPNWTQNNLTGYFDPKNNKVIALNCWEAFLYAPFLNPDIWQSLENYFPLICDYSNEINGRVRKNIANIIADVSLGRSGYMSAEKSRNCLLNIKENSFQTLTRIKNFLPDDSNNLEEFWEDKLKDWFRYVWPKQKRFRTSTSSIEMLRISLKMNNIFPDYIDLIENYLTELERGQGVFKEIEKSKLGLDYPNHVTKILSKTIPDNAEDWFSYKNSISKIISQIEENGVRDELKSELNRIKNVAARYNL